MGNCQIKSELLQIISLLKLTLRAFLVKALFLSGAFVRDGQEKKLTD